eukprot:TRINITY_DN4888_c0_g1_i1.p1 TRINITY_DN4888_c0_g1~~TRINITY_DN4888_c0_g1_i1.p1  ORF type:complete len:154 (-),score=18.34 TRINITY_DN4888_c0_g1_i1:34-495(-)
MQTAKANPQTLFIFGMSFCLMSFLLSVGSKSTIHFLSSYLFGHFGLCFLFFSMGLGLEWQLSSQRNWIHMFLLWPWFVWVSGFEILFLKNATLVVDDDKLEQTNRCLDSYSKMVKDNIREQMNSQPEFRESLIKCFGFIVEPDDELLNCKDCN